MILEKLYSGSFCLTESAEMTSAKYKQVLKKFTALMDELTEKLGKKDHRIVEELEDHVFNLQIEQSECYFKVGFSMDLTLGQEVQEQLEIAMRRN